MAEMADAGVRATHGLPSLALAQEAAPRRAYRHLRSIALDADFAATHARATLRRFLPTCGVRRATDAPALRHRRGYDNGHRRPRGHPVGVALADQSGGRARRGAARLRDDRRLDADAKRFPGALTKTVPIWCAVINRAVADGARRRRRGVGRAAAAAVGAALGGRADRGAARRLGGGHRRPIAARPRRARPRARAAARAVLDLARRRAGAAGRRRCGAILARAVRDGVAGDERPARRASCAAGHMCRAPPTTTRTGAAG